MEKIKEELSVFGCGFIGSRYLELYQGICIPRDDLYAKSSSILYTISTTHNYHVFDNPYLDIETNLIHLIRVLENAYKSFGKDLEINYLSSWFVYGFGKDYPATETSPCDPRGFYASTKLCAEHLVQSYCETFNMKYRILRLGNVVGVNEKASAKNSALIHMVRNIVQRKPVSLYKDNTTRDYIHVDDACKAINLVLSSKSTLNQVTNIGNGIPIKISDVIQYVVEQSHGRVEMKEPPKFHKQVQVEKMYLDITKLKGLGYVPTYSVYQAMDELIAHYTL